MYRDSHATADGSVLKDISLTYINVLWSCLSAKKRIYSPTAIELHLYSSALE
jgi:hypothetical protein